MKVYLIEEQRPDDYGDPEFSIYDLDEVVYATGRAAEDRCAELMLKNYILDKKCMDSSNKNAAENYERRKRKYDVLKEAGLEPGWPPVSPKNMEFPTFEEWSKEDRYDRTRYTVVEWDFNNAEGAS